MAKDAFLANNKPYNVPCVFQIWIKRSYNRKVPPKLEPIGYKFVKKQDNPDYSLRRVGVNAGNISKDIKNKSQQSHYFIKLEKNSDHFMVKYQMILWEHDNTVGPRSVNKQEFIKEINKIID